MATYTTKQNPATGNFELYQNGKLVSTGTESTIKQQAENPQQYGFEGVTPPSQTITSETLASQPTVPFQSSVPASVFDITALTSEEKKVQTQFEKLQELQTGLLGEETFKQEQKKTFGISELETTQQDLESQLNLLIAKSKQLDIESGLAPTKIEQQFAGTGATKGGVAPFTAAELFKINQQKAAFASDALIISANLDATTGKIASAYKKVEEAVNQKFAPLKEQIKVEMANLELVLKSPQYDAETKAKAQAQLDLKTKQAQEAQTVANNLEDTQKKIIDIVQFNPGKVSSQFMAQLSVAKTPLEVVQLAQGAGLMFEKADTSPQVIGSAVTGYFQYDPATKAWNPIAAKPAGITTSPGSETPDKPLSTNQIAQFKKLYGWVPPFGYSATQLQQYMADNPGATSQELQAGIETIQNESDAGAIPSDIGTTPEEVIASIMSTISSEQLKNLKKKADKAGVSSFWKSKTTDVKNYLESIKAQIEEALQSGFGIDEIIEFLTA